MEWGAFTSIPCISPPTHTHRFHSFEIKNKIGDVCLRLSFGQPSLAKNKYYTNILHPDTNFWIFKYMDGWSHDIFAPLSIMYTSRSSIELTIWRNVSILWSSHFYTIPTPRIFPSKSIFEKWRTVCVALNIEFRKVEKNVPYLPYHRRVRCNVTERTSSSACTCFVLNNM